MQLRIRTRFFISTVIAVLIVVSVAGFYLGRRLETALRERIQDELEILVRSVRESVEGEARYHEDQENLDRLADRIGEATAVRITVVSSDGTVIGDSKVEEEALASVANHADRPELISAWKTGYGFSHRNSSTVNLELLYVAVPAKLGPRWGRGAVRVARPLAEIEQAVASLWIVLAASGALALGLAIATGAGISWALARPVRHLAETAKQMAAPGGDGLASREGDEIEGLEGTFQQVTHELENALETLASERDRFHSVLDSLSDAVVSVDEQRCVVSFNRTAADFLGWNVTEAVGRSLSEIVRVPQLTEIVGLALSGSSANAEIEFGTGGSRRTLAVRATPQRGRQGAVLVLHDVTDIRRLETMRRDFVANVSHELRTPVSVIQANAETLLDGAMEHPEQAKRFVSAVRRHAERLGQLVADLLDISRIEAGEFRIELRSVRLAQVTKSVEHLMSRFAESRDATLKVNVSEDIRVWVDGGALEQVLGNLCENAIKYGPAGGEVELWAGPAGGDPSTIRLEVRDQGPGIPPEQRERVFERFYRVDPGRSREMGGTGLGLAIVKHLVEAMKGSVGVVPREPHGSVFWLEIQRAKDGDQSA